MAENENIAVEPVPETVEPAPEQPKEKKPSKGAKIWGGIKEYFRKQIVNLKRRPSKIAFLFLIVSTIINLLGLDPLSAAVNVYNEMAWVGIAEFVATLFSILVLVLYMNTFPKRKKMNIVMLVLTFVFMGVIIGMDLLFYLRFTHEGLKNDPLFTAAAPYIIAQIVFLGISAVLIATMPLYKKLLMKINTRKVVESAEFKEEIDTSAEV